MTTTRILLGAFLIFGAAAYFAPLFAAISAAALVGFAVVTISDAHVSATFLEEYVDGLDVRITELEAKPTPPDLTPRVEAIEARINDNQTGLAEQIRQLRNTLSMKR